MNASAVPAVLEALDYASAEGLVTAESTDVAANRSYLWQDLRAKFSIDAVYFHGDVPVVYFKGLEAASNEELAQLHRHLWNHNRAPLLIAVLPDEVRVYNCFAPPVQQREAGSDDSTILAIARQVADTAALQQQLGRYSRQEVESGRLARTLEGEFRRDRRAHQRLLDNLSVVRAQLLSRGLEDHIVNSLIGRSIFVRYLEHRGVLDSWFFQEYAEAASYTDILERSHEETYRLFAFLARKFNGDMFPVDDIEVRSVTPAHLQLLGSFLSGTEMTSGQMYFWAYDFKYIPIELISSIYEEFLHGRRAETGAYYTPPEIVDFVLNQVLPWDGDVSRPRVLDPSCGSGIFLVEAYRRLIERYRRALGGGSLTIQDLTELLTACIFGVDISPEAVRVTAFSLYLALLDVLEPKSIWTSVRFPRLIGSNLFVSDFFDDNSPFNRSSYDIIVGNPPWQSHLSTAAASYIHRLGRPIGDNQLAQAFLWRAPDLLVSGGRIGLLAPSKGVLFNKSGLNAEFRRRFFDAHAVTVVADFSSFRRSLFQHARGPMATIFYSHLADAKQRDATRYYTPHPSPLGDSLAGVVIAGDEVHTFSRREITRHPDVWKIALWGSARDLTFIEDLRQRFPLLGAVAHARGWIRGEGVKIGGDKKHFVPELNTMPFVPARNLLPGRVTSGREERIETTRFHRPREQGIYRAPHVLIRRGVLAGGRIAAAFLPYDAVFTSGVFSIAGSLADTAALKLLSGYLNSSLARYYHFLTAASWGVERDEISPHEHLMLPCAIEPEDTDALRQIVELVDGAQAADSETEWQQALDDAVFRAYQIMPAEQQLVRDAIETTIDMFSRGSRSRAFAEPSADELLAYAAAFTEGINGAIHASGDAFLATVYEGSSPYKAVEFLLTRRDIAMGSSRLDASPRLDHELSRMAALMLQEHSQRLYLLRNVKAFGPESIHVMKPAEYRYWTKTAAYNDADEMIAHLMRQPQLV